MIRTRIDPCSDRQWHDLCTDHFVPHTDQENDPCVDQNGPY